MRDKLRLGRKCNFRRGRVGRKYSYNLKSHFTMLGTSGAGKGVTLEIVNLLLGLRRSSIVSIDPSGQNACVCAEARRRFGHKVLCLNPFHLHVGTYPDLQDVGFNPLIALDPTSPHFFIDAASLADALIAVEGDGQKFFPESARGLLTWLIMFVRLRYGQSAHLGMVRDMLTGDLRAAAEAAVATGHPRITSLAYKYTGELPRSLNDVVTTAETQTRWLLDDLMRASLSKDGIDFACLKEKPPKSVFLILPAGNELEFHGVWLRVVISSALNALYRQGSSRGVPVIFMLSEFAQLGRLPSVLAAFGQARKYNLRLWTVLQNLGQIRDIYGQHGAETFIANSGCMLSFAAADPATAEFASLFSGEQSVLTMNASTDAHGGPAHINYGVQSERVWSPSQIRELPEFHALVWKSGQSKPQGVFLPPYWTSFACRRVMRQDPYNPMAGSTGWWVARQIGRVAGFAMAGALALAATMAAGAIAWSSLLPLLSGFLR
jgi:type IV secretion system protein VirD4